MLHVVFAVVSKYGRGIYHPKFKKRHNTDGISHFCNINTRLCRIPCLRTLVMNCCISRSTEYIVGYSGGGNVGDVSGSEQGASARTSGRLGDNGDKNGKGM